MRCLQTVSAHLRKLPVMDRFQLADCQRVLNNLNILPISLNIIKNTQQYYNELKYPTTLEKINVMHE